MAAFKDYMDVYICGIWNIKLWWKEVFVQPTHCNTRRYIITPLRAPFQQPGGLKDDMSELKDYMGVYICGISNDGGRKPFSCSIYTVRADIIALMDTFCATLYISNLGWKGDT